MLNEGEGWKLARDGEIGRDGRIPISTLGGLKARGNPLGATGVYQVVEVAQQLRGEAGAVPDQRRAHRHGAKSRWQRRNGRDAYFARKLEIIEAPKRQNPAFWRFHTPF